MIELPPARVLLVGMMGAGKTTVGRAVADRTGWPYDDNDDLVERAAGKSAKDLLRAGVARLRRAESAAIAEVLRIAPPLVASVPGGGVESAEDRRRLRGGGFVVWLRAEIETLADRLERDRYRPWLGQNADDALRDLYAGREAMYREVAHLVLDVEGESPDKLAESIISTLRKSSDSTDRTR